MSSDNLFDPVNDKLVGSLVSVPASTEEENQKKKKEKNTAVPASWGSALPPSGSPSENDANTRLSMKGRGRECGSSVRVQGMKKALDCGSMQRKAKGCFGVWGADYAAARDQRKCNFWDQRGWKRTRTKRNPGHQAGALSIKKGEGLFLWFGLYNPFVFKLWNVVKENIKILTKY